MTTAAASTVVVVHEGTAWWWPLAIAAAAAAASYAATWWFKNRDVHRESAFRAADLIDIAERAASSRDRFNEIGGANALIHEIQKARIRAQPLESKELDDRFRASLSYLLTFGTQPPQQQEPIGAWRSVGDSVANIREGLVPFLSAPRFLPFGRSPGKRTFPTNDELQAMSGDTDQQLFTALTAWSHQHNPR